MVKKGNWWKLAGVIIFLYVLLGGMLTPLRPGITLINPSRAKSGESVTINIKGYNSHFLTAKENRAWLKLDSIHAVKAIDFKPSTENDASLTFNIPPTFPEKKDVQVLSLILDNSVDGPFVQPNALFVEFVGGDSLIADTGWKQHGLGSFHTYEGIQFPYRNILNETIRNTFFHVALWFAMFILLTLGVYHSVRYLQTGAFDYDRNASAYTSTAILYGILGVVTGAIWAKHTWDTYWTNDIKLNMTAIALCIYLAYLILRGMNTDQDKRARLAASYNIFAYVAMIPLIFVIPRLTASLHPGNGGNPALGGEDLDHTLRLFFYPSIIALFILGMWISELVIRFERIRDKVFLENNKS